MRYELAQRWSGGKQPLEITETEFNAIRDANTGLVTAMVVEEGLDLVLDNFFEHDRDLLQLALRSAVFEEDDWSDLRASVLLVNRRLANLLTTCRLYLEMTPLELGALNDPALVTAFKAQTQIEWGNRLGYKTFEALRNYIQHQGLPISGVTYSGAWVPEHTREHRRHIVKMLIPYDKLVGDGRFNRKWKVILPLLQAQGDDLNYGRLVREYVSGIGAVHGKLRELLAPRIAAWQGCLLGSMHRYQAETGAELDLGVEALSINDEGVVIEEIEVFTGQIERWKALEYKNRHAAHLTRILITNE